MSAKPRVIHFVTGGGSGSTKVAIELACGHLRTGNYEPLLVLRRKKAALPMAMQAQITDAGLSTAWIDNGFKGKILRQLAEIIARFQPEIFAAHGYSEHLWGRQAAFAAHVPVVLHVEHNRERYLPWRKWAAQRLVAQTSATVCVSHSVAARVQELQLASSRLEVIHNGVDIGRWSAGARPLHERGQDIVMMARFGSQKDQSTLIRAAGRLAGQGWSGNLLLAGGGKESNRRACEKLALQLGLGDRIKFLGAISDGPAVLKRCRAAVLSTHYEGLPLALVEYMGAGCFAIGSEVSGVTDIIKSGVNGALVPPGDDTALADILQKVLAGGGDIQSIATQGQSDAARHFSLDTMISRYEDMFRQLTPP